MQNYTITFNGKFAFDGPGKFNIHRSVHRQYICRVQPTRRDFSRFICFCKTLYMFQTGFPSIIRSLKLLIQRQVFVRPIMLPAASLASSSKFEYSGIRVAGCLQHGYHSNPTTPKLQHTSNQEQYDQCGNSTE